jgi:uncharacterized protein YcaQ
MAGKRISKPRARLLAVRAQLLDGRAGLPSGKAGVAQAISRLGYVQIDTISVVQRAHNHTLWTRLPDFREESLLELQAMDRKVFEYWAHAASYLPISDYRYYAHRMRHHRHNPSIGTRRWIQKYPGMLERVLDRIRSDGPLAAKDFEAPPGRKSTGWWDWKPAKSALEILYWQGDLMIGERRNFQRIYDLTERILPADTETAEPSEAEFARFLVRRALEAYAIASEKEIHEHIRGGSRASIAEALEELIGEGEVVRVSLDGSNRGADFALATTLERTRRAGRSKKIALLSPFDNLIIQRDRTLRLFDFDYVLECYTPAAKRKYGYYVLPVLWGTNLVARLDPKADRKRKLLEIRSLLFEPGFEAFEAILTPLANKLSALASSNACERVQLGRVRPAKLKRTLNRLTKEALQA